MKFNSFLGGKMVDCTNTNKKSENCGDDIEEWSDDMCCQIALEDSFPIKVKELSAQKDIINRFLNFYLSGKVQKGLSARDIIFAVISIMPLTNESEKFIWDDHHYSEDGTLLFLTPECQLKNEIKSVLMKRESNFTEEKLKTRKVHTEQINVTKVFDGEVLTNDSRCETNDVDVSLDNFTMDEKVLPDKSSKDFTDDSKFQTNEDGNALKTEVTDENVQSSPLDKLNWFRKKPLYKAKMNTQTIKYDPVKNAAFCTSCNKLLAKWDTDMDARIELKYFFGIVALSLMRSIVKSYEHVMQMFMSTFPNRFAHTRKFIIYSPPSAICVRKTFKTFRKVDRKIQIMFAKLVINSIVKKAEEQFRPPQMNIFNATILAPTSNYGMEIINMIQEVACMSKEGFVKFEAFRLEETAVSWNRIDKFLKKYLYTSTYQSTCFWARVIDTEKFKYLTCENNYELAVVIASFIESSTGNNAIWNSRWVKSGTNLDKYKQLGHKIYEDLYNLNLIDFSKKFMKDHSDNKKLYCSTIFKQYFVPDGE